MSQQKHRSPIDTFPVLRKESPHRKSCLWWGYCRLPTRTAKHLDFLQRMYFCQHYRTYKQSGCSTEHVSLCSYCPGVGHSVVFFWNWKNQVFLLTSLSYRTESRFSNVIVGHTFQRKSNYFTH